MSPSQSPPYLDHIDVFSADSTTDLPKHTGINNHPIDLVDDKQPPYDLLNHPPALQYCPSARRTVAFDCAFEVSITRPSRIDTCCLGLRLYPLGCSGGSDKKSAF